MPSWNPFSRGRSPRGGGERLASARALAESTRDLRAAAAADEGAAKPTPEQALVALQVPPGAGIQSTARLRRVAGDADDAARAGRARRALDHRGHVPRRGLPGGLRGRGQARGRRRRAPPGPGPGARGRARRRGPRRPRRLRGGPAGRRRRARYGARRRAQGRGHDRHLRRDHAVLGRDDGLVAGRRRRGDGPPAHVQRLPRRRRAQPHEAGDEEVRRGERRRRLALPHRHDALDGRGPRERLRPRGAAQDVQRAARRRPGDRCASPRRRRRRRVRAQAA